MSLDLEPAHAVACARPVRARWAWAALALWAAGCASYTEKTAAALADFEAGRFDEARAVLSDERVIGSPFLRNAEVGMVELVQGRWDEAQAAFDGSVAAVKELEERALLGPEELGETLGVLLVSESAATYQGEGYERVQLHAALALCYLARGNLDGVYVETRRSNKLLETEEQLYQTKYAAGGFGHLMSALSYELQRRYDEAYIDYKRMHEKGVGLELAGKALVRIAQRLHYNDELPGWIEAYGEAAEVPSDAAAIVVLAGIGVGPYKIENTASLPTPVGLAQFSVPAFVARPQQVSALELAVDGGEPLRTALVEDVSVVARENLEDRMGWLAARSALRAAGKFALTYAAAEHVNDEYGGGAAVGVVLLGSLLTAATERADTRAWNTLPNSWQAGRLFVAPGEHELELSAIGGERVALGRYALEPGETLVVIARTLGARLYAFPIGGARMDAAPVEPSPEASETETSTTATP